MFTCECITLHEFMCHIALSTINVNHIFRSSDIDEIEILVEFLDRVRYIFPYVQVICVSDRYFEFKCYYYYQ